MKSLTIGALVALTVAHTGVLHAQSIGFKVGPTFSTISTKPEAPGEQERINSFGGGGFVRFGAGPLNLQVDVLALTKGSTLTNPEDSFERVSFKLGYIEVPVTALFTLGSGPYILAGPTIAFETSCKFELEFEGTEVKEDCDDTGEGESIERKKVDVGFVGGAGFHFPVGPGSVVIEARHTWGLTNLNEGVDADEGESRNRSIAVLAGFAIPIGSR